MNDAPALTSGAPAAGLGIPGGRARGFLTYKTNDDLRAEQEQQQRDAEAAARTMLPQVSQYVNKAFEDAVLAKQEAGVQESLIRDLAQRNGEYLDEDKAKLEAQGEPIVFDNVTGVKFAAAYAWLTDIIRFTDDDQPWTLGPTPRPEFPPDLQEAIVAQATMDILQRQLNGQLPSGIAQLPPDQRSEFLRRVAAEAGDLRAQIEEQLRAEAKQRADRMGQVILDQLAEGGLEEAFDSFLEDFCTFRTAFLKGPVIVMDRKRQFIQDPSGRLIPATAERIGYKIESPSPLDMYPGRECSDVRTGPIMERQRLTRSELDALRDQDGVNEDELDAALEDNQDATSSVLRPMDATRAALLDKKFIYNPHDTIEALQHHGFVRGYVLNDWYGQDTRQGVFEDPLDYPVCLVVVKTRVIKIIHNFDPLGGTPYYAASYRHTNGSVWGRSVPMLMRDRQKAINTAYRALCINLPFAARPMGYIDPAALPQGVHEVEEMQPGQLWQLTKRADGTTAKPLELTWPPLRAREYLETRDRLAAQSDDDTGIPPYTYGNDRIAGAGRTARGLSMLLTSATRGIKRAVANIDGGVLKPLIERMWLLNMFYNPDETIKGDVVIQARGALSLFVKDELLLRRVDILSSTNNPTDRMIFGLQERAELWRQVFHSVGLSAERTVPTREEMRERIRAAAGMGEKGLATPRTGPTSVAVPIAPAPAGAPTQEGSMP